MKGIKFAMQKYNRKYDVIIFDGNNTAYKAYYVNRQLCAFVDGKEKHTGMIYGFLNILRNVYNQFGNKDTKVIIVWDSDDACESNRNIDYLYKNDRKPKTFDEKVTKESIHQFMIDTADVLSLLNIPQFKKAKTEADDIIASISNTLYKKDKSVLIVTEDKDYRQLINDKINLYGMNLKTVWDTNEFTERTGILKPSHFADYLAIVGDSSDGYKGVNGFGDIKGIGFVNSDEYSDYEHIVDKIISGEISIDDNSFLSDKHKALLNENLDDLHKCFKLALLDKNITKVEYMYDGVRNNIIKTFMNTIAKFNMKHILSHIDDYTNLCNTHYKI